MKQDDSRRLRRKKVLLWIGVLLAASGIGAAVLIWTPLRIPCPFFALTGLQCPSCGGTRMVEALLRLDFSAALAFNPFLMAALPFLALLFFLFGIRYIRTGRRDLPWWMSTGLILTAAAGILFTVIRNLETF